MPQGIALLRGAARLSGAMVAGGYLALVAGHILYPDSGPPTQVREWLGIALLSTCCLSVLAWRREEIAGFVSLAALAAFVYVVRLDRPALIAVLATPGMLFVIDWVVRRRVAASTDS